MPTRVRNARVAHNAETKALVLECAAPKSVYSRRGFLVAMDAHLVSKLAPRTVSVPLDLFATKDAAWPQFPFAPVHFVALTPSVLVGTHAKTDAAQTDAAYSGKLATNLCRPLAGFPQLPVPQTTHAKTDVVKLRTLSFSKIDYDKRTCHPYQLNPIARVFASC